MEATDMLRVFLENTVVSTRTRHNCGQEELAAIDQLYEWNKSGEIDLGEYELGTSRHTQREMERAPAQHQAKLKSALEGLDIAKDDHKVVDSHAQTDPLGGCISNVFSTDTPDEELYSKLRGTGLDEDDAKHLLYAVGNKYERFVTLDIKHFLSRRHKLEKLCPSIRIRKPSELVEELRTTAGPAGSTSTRPGP
jgi:hypothetical protein